MYIYILLSLKSLNLVFGPADVFFLCLLKKCIFHYLINYNNTNRLYCYCFQKLFLNSNYLKLHFI